MPRKSRFISVEIVIRTNSDCGDFVRWFQSDDNYIERMPCDTHAWYVCFSPLPCGDADATIKALCDAIRELPVNVRKQWDDAGFREFYVGYQVGDEPHCYQEHLGSDTIAEVAALGAGVGIALYPAPEP